MYLLVALGFSMYLNQSFSLEIPRLLAHVVYIIPFTEHHWYNEVYWTLAIEFQYYVLMGLLVLCLFSERSFWMHFGLIAFALSGILMGDNRLVFYYAPVFLMGIITFLHFIHRLSLPVFLTYAMIFFLMMFFMHSLLIALFSAFTVVGIFFIKKENVILKQLGDISYSLYLVHGLSGMQLLYFLAPHADNLFLRMVSVFAALFFSLLAAWIFYRCVEWPAEQWASRFK